MATPFKWYCCRYMLRVVCVDLSFADTLANVFHRCSDRCYKPDRPGRLCEKDSCVNPRKAQGIPKTIHKHYA